MTAVTTGPALVLSTSWEAVLGQALADAITYRQPDGECSGCGKDPAGTCGDHQEDEQRADAYLALAAELRIDVAA